jgi:rhodanese-related sulfurtransferase
MVRFFKRRFSPTPLGTTQRCTNEAPCGRDRRVSTIPSLEGREIGKTRGKNTGNDEFRMYRRKEMLNRKALSMLTVAFILSLTARGLAEEKKQPAWMSSPAKEMVDKARASVKLVTIQDLKKAIDAKEDIVIIDVRNPNEYDAAHIPGAVNVSRGLLEFQIWSVVPDKNAKIYVYCRAGGRAVLATKQLNEFGYKNAVSVDSGGFAWATAGYPIEISISDEEIIIVPVAQGKRVGQ